MTNEPVAYAYRDEKGELVWSSFTPVILPDGWTETPLYTRPPADPEPAPVADGLVERLNERAKRLRGNNASCQLIVDLLKPEMDKFNARTGHDLYTVRMAVDHVSSIRTQTKEAEELEQAATRIQSDAETIAELVMLVEEAFKDGWMVNAIPPDEHEAGAAYVHSCCNADWAASRPYAVLSKHRNTK